MVSSESTRVMNSQSIIQIGKALLPGITFLLGLLTKHVFDLWKNRLPRIKYRIYKSFLAASSQDALFGSVQVLHNNHPVRNLYMVKIVLQNSSNKDFKDVPMLLWCDSGSMILISYGVKIGSVEPLEFTKDYNDLIANVNNMNVQQVQQVLSRRKYLIPVLNRDDIIEFSCLLTNTEGKEPNLYLESSREGLRLEPTFIQPQLFLGEPQSTAALLGLFATGILLIPIVYFGTSVVWISAISWLAGAFCLLPGVFILKMVRWMRKIVR